MEFDKLADARYSLRRYAPQPVEQEKIDSLLAVCRIAPTAHNNQPQRILVLNTPEALEKLKACTPCHFNAPLAMLVCYDKDVAWRREDDGSQSGEVDVGIVGTHLMMQAVELGLGSCWVMAFDPAAMIREFNLPANIVPMALFPLGYPAEGAKPSRLHADRQPLEDMVFYQSF